MKILHIITILTTLACHTFAGNTDSLKVNISKKHITIGNAIVSAQTPISKVIALLGKPSRVLKVANVDRIYIYDSLGLTFDIDKTTEKKVHQITVSFYPKGNNRIAQGTYQGVLILDAMKVTAQTNSTQIAKYTLIKDFNCFSAMCSSAVSKTMMNVIMDFMDDKRNKLMSISFVMEQKK
jgi:hypothetical protein